MAAGMQRRGMIAADGNPEHGDQRQNRNNQNQPAYPERHTAARFDVVFLNVKLAADRQFVKNNGGYDKHQRPARLARIGTNHCRHAVKGGNQSDKGVKNIFAAAHFVPADNLNRYRRVNIRQQRHDDGNRGDFAELLGSGRRHGSQNLQGHDAGNDGQSSRRHAAAVDAGKNIAEQAVIGGCLGRLSDKQRPASQRTQIDT